MKLSQPNHRQRLLTYPARLPLLTVLEKKEHLLEMTDAADSINLSEKTKPVIEVVSEEMDSV